MTRSFALLAVPMFAATMLLGSFAQAKDCTSDADCGGAGFHCLTETVGGVASCDANGNCTDEPAPPQPTTGTCESGTITCASDADCPSYESCQEVATGGVVDTTSPACPPDAPCPADDPPSSGGSAGTTVKECVLKQTSCQADTDCGAGFACEAGPSTPCAAPACKDGQDCPPVDCDPTPATSLCEPKEIDCTSNADCPSGWQCFDYSASSCEGSTGTGSAPPAGTGGGATPGSGTPGNPGARPQDDDGGSAGCTTVTRSLCTPPGLAGGGYAESGSSGGSLTSSGAPEDDGSDNGKGTTPPTASNGDATTDGGSDTTPASSSSDGGCSASGGASGAFGALLVALGAVLARRKR